MARPRLPPDERRVKRTVRLAPDLDDWVMAQTETGGRFKDFTHAVEVALTRLREEEEAPSRASRSLTSKK